MKNFKYKGFNIIRSQNNYFDVFGGSHLVCKFCNCKLKDVKQEIDKIIQGV